MRSCICDLILLSLSNPISAWFSVSCFESIVLIVLSLTPLNLSRVVSQIVLSLCLTTLNLCVQLLVFQIILSLTPLNLYEAWFVLSLSLSLSHTHTHQISVLNFLL